MKYSFVLPAITLMITGSACSDSGMDAASEGSLTIEFDNHFGEEDLELNTEYINSKGEVLSISKLNYYISNIEVTTSGGETFVVPQESSYFLVREADPESQEVVLNHIPTGDYNRISFLIGVDSLRSTMDPSLRKGVLDLTYEEVMYWTPENGYVFLKLEGTSPDAPANDGHHFTYHIGGFGGLDESEPTINNIKIKTINMGSARAQVRSNKSPEIHLHVDVSEFFSNPESISIQEHPTVMFSEYSKTLANNYVNMFKYDHVHN